MVGLINAKAFRHESCDPTRQNIELIITVLESSGVLRPLLRRGRVGLRWSWPHAEKDWIQVH